MTDSPQCFTLPEKPAAKDLNDLTAFLRDQAQSAVQIDAAHTTMIPAQCLQILLSAEQTWAAAGLGFEMINLSDSCRDDLGLFGLSSVHFLNEVHP
jgi:anti-anti-sigma regulatory factor